MSDVNSLLTEEDMLNVIDAWDESEDEFDDELDLEYYGGYSCHEELFDPLTIEGLSNTKIQPKPKTAKKKGPANAKGKKQHQNKKNQSKTKNATNRRAKPTITWEHKAFANKSEEMTFKGESKLPDNILEMETPYQFFKYFFTDQIIDHIVEQTLLFSKQPQIENSFNVTPSEIRKWIGISYVMSVVHIADTRRYWSPIIGNKLIQETMTVNRFETIKRYIHFNDNEKMLPKNDPNHDRLFKIRPLVQDLLARFKTIPPEEILSIDEQVCATKARCYLKVYLKNKPHKWGYKLYLACGSDGFAYAFEVYTGQENDPSVRLSSESDLGSSSNVVVRLLRIIDNNLNHKVYFDNYYSGLPLLVELAKKSVYCVGTVRRDRIPNCQLPTESDMKSKCRGSSDEYVTTVDGVDVTSVVWKDSKLVHFISTLSGIQPMQTADRWDKTLKKSIPVECPNVEKLYNKSMGGVDLLNSLIGRYKIGMRSKKWYVRMFFHLLDITMVNSWLLYKRSFKQQNKLGKMMTLLEFRLEVAECMCKVNNSTSKKRRQKTTLEGSIEPKRKKKSATNFPPTDVRLDTCGHYPIWNNQRQRCKHPHCKGLTFISCSKCNVFICCKKNKNCFVNFHTKK